MIALCGVECTIQPPTKAPPAFHTTRPPVNVFMPYPDLKQSVSSRDPLWERNRQLEAAIREAISTLPDYAETLDNSAACDVKWVKQHLIAVLNH